MKIIAFFKKNVSYMWCNVDVVEGIAQIIRMRDDPRLFNYVMNKEFCDAISRELFGYVNAYFLF